MNNSCFSPNLNSIDCLRKAIRTVSLRATVSGMLACLPCPGFSSQHWRGTGQKQNYKPKPTTLPLPSPEKALETHKTQAVSNRGRCQPMPGCLPLLTAPPSIS